MDKSLDKIKGSVAAGAAGDALGYAVEFMTANQIKAYYGEDGITEYRLRNGEALFSDDTQMTLFTAQGLLLAKKGANPEEYISGIRDSYKCWYITQTAYYSPEYEKMNNPLMSVEKLYSRRAPGTTCMSAVRQGAEGSVAKPINNSKGCGGVMRVAPVGLFLANTDTPIETSDMIAAEAAALTHGHELGYMPAAALAHIVRLGIEDRHKLQEAAQDAIDYLQREFRDTENRRYFTELMQKSISLAQSSVPDMDALSALGEGWVGDEALAVALFCALRYSDDFDRALTVSVNHDGDSDSTGAVTGNILGAFRGYEALPEKYKDNLELLPLLLETAEKLWAKN